MKFFLLMSLLFFSFNSFAADEYLLSGPLNLSRSSSEGHFGIDSSMMVQVEVGEDESGNTIYKKMYAFIEGSDEAQTQILFVSLLLGSKVELVYSGDDISVADEEDCLGLAKLVTVKLDGEDEYKACAEIMPESILFDFSGLAKSPDLMKYLEESH